MTKTSSLLCVVFGLLSACEGEDPPNATVPGEITAVLSGTGVPGQQSTLALNYSEIWVDRDGFADLSRFEAHQWSTEPGRPAYDLFVNFEPRSAPGSSPIVHAMVCYTTCDSENGSDCTGPCFTNLKSGTVEVRELSDDGNSFDLSFAFEVADENGAIINVSNGTARTTE